ncbi:Swi3-domain-containing protein [Xylariaceae sp. FL0594]|nr:Swi3-domain-containing protein [Xylariaceae sp. FL0594]
MASRLAARQPPKPPKPPQELSYDFDSDPFASSEDEAAKSKRAAEAQSKKRKDASGLGIDEEVSITKKPRVPRVKLDETRLLSENGIPKLRRKAGNLKLKGKGHEFSDAARLLSFYQLWLDDLFPKAKFLDALKMVEKAGHGKTLRLKRIEWIGEGKPKTAGLDDDDDDLFGDVDTLDQQQDTANPPTRIAPIFENSSKTRPKTPVEDDTFGDDDIYDATPKRPTNTNPGTKSLFGGGASNQDSGEPDEDDLDALMAEAEAHRPAPTSIFGSGNGKAATIQHEPNEDDLDALMAEAETGNTATSQPTRPASKAVMEDEEDDLHALMAEAEASTTSAAKRPKPASTAVVGNEEDDLDALMAEADANAADAVNPTKPTKNAVVDNEEDDLDALMAEAEAEAESSVKTKPPAEEDGTTNEVRPPSKDLDEDADAEAAMAELDGLW